jgi:DNA-binding XRE family transcriptional regulator
MRDLSQLTTHDDLLAAEIAADPEFAREWERLALARAVAVELIRFRSKEGLSQRALAARLGVSQPRVAELESGELNPKIETLLKISAAIGVEFALAITPAGRAPRLAGKAVRDAEPHDHAGGSLFVAAG